MKKLISAEAGKRIINLLNLGNNFENNRCKDGNSFKGYNYYRKFQVVCLYADP